MHARLFDALALAGILAIGAVHGAGTAHAQAPNATGLSWSDQYDDVYWSRPHNTYERSFFSRLSDPLDIGFRSIEIDIHEYVGSAKEFPVKHDSGASDTGNNCRGGAGGYLRDCLRDVRAWSDAHPGHEPITVQVDLKVGFWNSTTGWSASQLQELDRQVAEILGTRLYRPENLRAWTGYSSLRQGVAAVGWPAVSALQGKVIVTIMGGPIGDKNDTQEEYVMLHGSQAHAFVCPNASIAGDFHWYGNADDFDDPNTNKWVVCGNVEAVKYWKDVAASAHASRQLMNLWGGSGFDQFHLMYLAVGWGASMISRENTDGFQGKLPYNGVRRSVPVVFSLVNVNSGKCADIQGANYSNGADINQYTCHFGANQTWIYSDETQLRAQGNSKYCYDIEGGNGNLQDKHHIWDCDGGSSEKWKLQPNGSFVGMNGRCIDVPYSSTSNGVRLWHYTCNGSTAQRFSLQ